MDIATVRPFIRAVEDESSLVRQARAGNAEAFAQLYDAYMERVYRYVYFRVSDRQTAEDITSQVFLRAWEHIRKYRLDGSFLAWLYTIARNAVIDNYRTRKPLVALDDVVPVPADTPAPQEVAELRFDSEALRGAIRYLTDEQQHVITLKFIAGYSTDEIARALRKRPGAIRALQMRALQALARHLENDEE